MTPAGRALKVWENELMDEARGWIEWNGGECPVAKVALVEVRWDDGTTTGPTTAGGWDWRNHGTPADIVAYRLVDEPGASTGGWVNWSGGDKPPVAEGAVWVRFRDGDEEEDLARAFRWTHNGNSADIVAYRVSERVKKPESALSTQPSGTHYSDAAIQPVQFIEANKLGFLEGCIVKRATRHNHPTGKGAEDIRKIIHEARLILELRYGEAA
jgi:hypothetical protein